VTSNREVPNTFSLDKPIVYYQICSFPDPKTGRYHMRKIFYNGESKPDNIIYYYLSPDQKNLFYQHKKFYEYKEYPNHNFDEVDLPTQSLLDQARSELFTDKGDGFNHKLV